MGRDNLIDHTHGLIVLISIHTPRVGRDNAEFGDNYTTYTISIHTPRVGRDSNANDQRAITIISIHTPRVGRDLHSDCLAVLRFGFQSTRPVWGVTALHRTGQG